MRIDPLATTEGAALLVHPQFDPIALHLGPLSIRWYGLMYVLAFIAVIVLGKWRIRRGFGEGLQERDITTSSSTASSA